jgi:tetratricopeptide (TPR) repeat protein
LFHTQEKYSEAEKYYLLAIKNKNINAMYNLALLYQNEAKYLDSEKYYLLAIENGQIDSLYNLASLYNKQKKYELAEKYYLLAIDKGQIGALNNLAILYYFQNLKKEKSLEFIKKYYEISKDKKSAQPKIIIEIWNGIFDDLEQRLVENFEENKFENLDTIIGQLLVQQQKSLMFKLFQNENFGKELKDRYTILYYVTLILNNSEEENFELKIPPEIQSTVDEVILEIKERQEFYGY